MKDLSSEIKYVNVNHIESRKKAVTHCFCENFKKSFSKKLWLSVVTFGVYPYKEYKKAKLTILQAFAARKLHYFTALQNRIETLRQQQKDYDPRRGINDIFIKIQSEKTNQEEDALEFRAIYYPTEILLFITNPVRNTTSIRLHRINTSRHHFDYLKIWHGFKKKSFTNQYRQIQNINFCNKTLREEYHLSTEKIHDRLSRSSVCRKKHPYLLTKFKELANTFQELVIAYQDFEELSNHNLQLFHLIKTLSKTSKKDIDTLQTYLASSYLPRDLPLENRRQLIQLANQQDILYHMSKEKEQFSLCALILSRWQWDFLLSIQGVSKVTCSLLGWAFEESSNAIKNPSFLEQLFSGIEKKLTSDFDQFPTLSEEIQKNPALNQMTLDFAKESNRVWPSFHLYKGEDMVFHMQKTDALTIEKLIDVYLAIQKLCETDVILFCLLQQAVSQVGKHAFQSSIEKEVVNLLGEKSEYFLPIFSNSTINIIKVNSNEVEIRYAFTQVIIKKGEVQHAFEKEKYMIIAQPLIKQGEKWTSPEPKIEVAEKKGIP